MTPESQTKCDDTRLAGKFAANDYDHLSQLGEQQPSRLTEQYIDLISKQARSSSKPALTAEEFYKTFNEDFSAISLDQTEITRSDIARYKQNPLKLAPSLQTWTNPAESRRVAMLDELSANFDDLQGLSRASLGLQSGVRKEDVKLFHDIHETRMQAGCGNSNSEKERALYQKAAGEGLGAGSIGITIGSILGAEGGALLRTKFLRSLSECCEGEAKDAFLGRAMDKFPKFPAMLIGAAVLSVAGGVIGSRIDNDAGSSNYDQDKERLNRLMSNMGNKSH